MVPVVDLQIVYYRNNAWTNPLSSDAGGAGAAATPAGIGAIAAGLAGNTQTVPEGIRLVLQLAPGHAIGGSLVRDWVNPVIGGGKS